MIYYSPICIYYLSIYYLLFYKCRRASDLASATQKKDSPQRCGESLSKMFSIIT